MITNSLFSSHWRSSSSMGSLNSIRNLKIHQKSVTSLKMTSLDFASLPSQTSMVLSGINAWSVNGASLNSSDLASSFFAASLFPYLAMLFFLSRKESKTPSISFFGFSFLLAFVAATIPAGIYAKYEYHDILANVDWLHGLAESLLTVTNILIITGFRQTRSASTTDNKSQELQLQSNGIAILGALFGIISLLGSGFLGVDLAPHIEPQNALSLPTWMVHSSSILEWLIAMTLIWDHAYTSSNPRWKGMTIAMIPAHASGMCACAFHFFYNNPDLYWMVALQAGLTVVGNTCMAAAAYRIYDYEHNKDSIAIAEETSELGELAMTGLSSSPSSPSSPLSSSSLMETSAPRAPVVDSDASFFTKLVLKSALLAGVVKYGELYLDFPFASSSGAAAAAIGLPVLQNAIQWAQRSLSKTDITYRS